VSNKLVLATNGEFVGVTLFSTNKKQICITFTGIADYTIFRNKFSYDSMKTIKLYRNDTEFDTYENYTKFASSQVFEEDAGLKIIVFFELDELTADVMELKKTVETLQTALNQLISSTTV
jgi:hypothetical protein